MTNASKLQVVIAASRICGWVASQRDFTLPKVDSPQLFADAAIVYFQDKVEANQAATLSCCSIRERSNSKSIAYRELRSFRSTG